LTGSTDRQADPGQVQEWADAFRSSGNRDVTARLLPDLNHLFVHDPDGSPSNYARLPGANPHGPDGGRDRGGVAGSADPI